MTSSGSHTHFKPETIEKHQLQYIDLPAGIEPVPLRCWYIALITELYGAI